MDIRQFPDLLIIWFVFNSECIIIFFWLHIQDIGEKVYTVPKVVNEIKDKATLQRLQFLPYQLTPKTPSPESIRIGMIYVFKISSSLVSATLVEVKNLDWCKVKAHKVIREVLPKIRAHIALTDYWATPTSLPVSFVYLQRHITSLLSCILYLLSSVNPTIIQLGNLCTLFVKSFVIMGCLW